MKKIFFLILISCLFLPSNFAFASANYEWSWKYLFHLQIKNGVLGIDSDAEQPYDPIPESYSESIDLNTADFHGDIISVKGKNLSKFGFNKPQTVVAALQKSIFDVSAPFYADADHVAFFSKTGAHLFDVSLKSTSFCNDNNKCDVEVGENYLNCPNDCHATTNPTIEPNSTTPEPNIVPAVTPSITPEPTVQPETPGLVTTTTPSTKTFFTKGVIIMLVGGTLLVILGIILLRIKKNMD